MQPLFSKLNIFSYLALALSIVASHFWFQGIPNRTARVEALVAVRFVPVRLAAGGFAPLRLAGAWQVEVDDPRFGGISALAIDGGQLLALSDSGSVIRLPRPGAGGQAMIRDLPAGPGNPRFKRHRDSEALARDPLGRGWWVAFENWHELWLYGPDFRHALGHLSFGSDRWPVNRGIEALVADERGMLIFPETGNEWLEVGNGRVRAHRLAGRFGQVADAVRLPDGRLLLVARKFGLAGIAKRLVEVDAGGAELRLRSLARLELGARDNVEAVAVDPLGGGGTRLWLMTDNDFRPRKATLLVALDLP